MDALFWTLFHHDHTVDPTALTSLAGPEHRPTLTLLTSGGAIPAGTTFYYRVSYVDAYGNETEAGIQGTINTPAAIAAPPALSAAVATTGGLLGPGTYRYSLAHTQAGGLTTRAPNTFTVVVPTGTNTNKVTITLNTLPSGATGWSVFRRDPGSDEYYYLTSTAGPTTFVDDGSYTLDCNRLRPAINTTNSVNRIQIDIDPQDLPLPSRVASWRIYRTTVGGVYNQNSLVAQVVDTLTEGGADLVTSYIDEGFTASAGSPLEQRTSPPAVPGIDAETAFSDDSGRIPGRLNPWRVNQMHTYIHGQVTSGEIYNRTYLYEDMTPSRVDVILKTAPSGSDASNHAIVRVKDTALVNEVQSYWTDARVTNEFQQIINNSTAGTYTLTFSAQTTSSLNWNATATEIATALEALSNINDVFVYGTGTATDPFVIEFIDPGLQNVAQLTYSGGSLTGTLSISTVTEGSNGGTFTLTDGVSTTSAIAATASAATIKTRLETDITAINTVTVTGTGTQTDPWVVTYTDPAATNVPLLTANVGSLNGLVYGTEEVRGHGNTIINVKLQTVTATPSSELYYYWAAPSVVSDKEYAVNMVTVGGTVVSDTFGEIDSVVELNAQNEFVAWYPGFLEAATYKVRYYVADVDQNSTFDVEVFDLVTGTVTAVIEQTVTDHRQSYEPAFELEFTTDGSKNIALQVTKTSNDTNRVRVDRIEYEAVLDSFLAGETLTVEGVIVGSPTNTGENVQVNLWY